MKYSLDEIEAMLKEVNPYSIMSGTVVVKPWMNFMKVAPEIIESLIEEIKTLRQIVHIVNTTPGETITLQAMADHNGITITELKKGFESK